MNVVHIVCILHVCETINRHFHEGDENHCAVTPSTTYNSLRIFALLHRLVRLCCNEHHKWR